MLALPVCASAQATADQQAAPAAAAPAPAATGAGAPGAGAPEPAALPADALPGHLAEETRTATFEVTAIDPTARTISLRSPGQEPQNYLVDKEVRNLDQVKVGDRVSVTYHESTSIKVLPPGELGKEDNAAIQRSEPGAKPGGVASRSRSITVKVSSIFPEQKEFLTRNADGELRTWKVKDAKDLEQFKSGDRLQLTSVSSMAISVTPAPPPSPADAAAPAAAKPDAAAPAVAPSAEPAKAPEPAKPAEPAK
jgi:hypothetical protein